MKTRVIIKRGKELAAHKKKLRQQREFASAYVAELTPTYLIELARRSFVVMSKEIQTLHKD